jgi:hypothetical protein
MSVADQRTTLFSTENGLYAQLRRDGERKWEGGREQVIAAPVGWEEGGGTAVSNIL